MRIESQYTAKADYIDTRLDRKDIFKNFVQTEAMFIKVATCPHEHSPRNNGQIKPDKDVLFENLLKNGNQFSHYLQATASYARPCRREPWERGCSSVICQCLIVLQFSTCRWCRPKLLLYFGLSDTRSVARC